MSLIISIDTTDLAIVEHYLRDLPNVQLVFINNVRYTLVERGDKGMEWSYFLYAPDGNPHDQFLGFASSMEQAIEEVQAHAVQSKVQQGE